MEGTERSGGRVLNVHMLGEFQIMLDDVEIKLPGGNYSKTMRLFILIAYYGDKGISREDVLELLYGDGEYANGPGSLRVASHRLRRQLIEAGVLTEAGSISRRSIFRLDQEDLEVVIDARVFEETAQKALKAVSGEEQMRLLEKACGMYTGEFLMVLSADMWVAGKQAAYQNLYFQCLRRYLKLLKQADQYERRLHVVRNAIRLYPYEEWYIAELDTLMDMEQWTEAREAARRSAESLTERMGIRLSRDMEERRKKTDIHLKGSSKNLMEICRELEQQDESSGAYYCSYQAFVGTYHYEMRRIERTGESLYLLLCSLTEKEENRRSKTGELTFENIMDQLGTSIREALRRADVYTRYGKNQYLLLLMGIKQEDCSSVSSRIQSYFNRTPDSGKYQLHHFIAPVVRGGWKEGQEEEPPVRFGQRSWGCDNHNRFG